MVDREVNIKVNEQGIEEAKKNLDELKQTVKEVTEDIRIMQASVTSLSTALKQLRENNININKNISQVATPKEQMRLVGQKGEFTVPYSSSNNSINVGVKSLISKAIENELSLLSHTHPRGTTFSTDDIKTYGRISKGYNKEFTAQVTNATGTSGYNLVIPPGFNNSPLIKEYEKRMASAPSKGLGKFQNKTLEELSEKYGLNYNAFDMGAFKEQRPQKTTQRFHTDIRNIVLDKTVGAFVEDFNKILGDEFNVKVGRLHPNENKKEMVRTLTVATKGLLGDVQEYKDQINEAFDKTRNLYAGKNLPNEVVPDYAGGTGSFEFQSSNEYNRVGEGDKTTRERARANAKAYKEKIRAEREAAAGLNRLYWASQAGGIAPSMAIPLPMDVMEVDDILNKQHGEKRGSTFEISPRGKMVPGAQKINKGGIKEQVTDMARGIGKTLDEFVNKSGAVGRLSWTFTSLAMSSLGVYFSLLGIVNLISQGINTLFAPLKNLESFVTAYAYSKMIFDEDSLINIDNFMKKLGVDIGDVAKATMYLQGVMGTIQASIGAFGAKLLLDPDVQKNIEHMIGMIQDFLLDPDTMTLAKGIFQGMEDALPAVIEGITLLGNLIKTVIIPNARLFATAWAISLVAMPVFSFISALFNVAKAIGQLIGLLGGLGTKIQNVFSKVGQTTLTDFATKSKVYGMSAGSAYAAGFILGLAGIYAIEKSGGFQWLREQGAKTGAKLTGKDYVKPADEKHSDWDLIAYITGKPSFLTARAAGGPLKAGQMALVGEKGPEIIVSKGDTEVIPNDKIRKLAGGTQGGNSLWYNDEVEDNTVALDDNTRATKKLNELLSGGTNPFSSRGINSAVGGPTQESLARITPITLTQGGRTWNMNTSARLRDQYVSTSGYKEANGTDYETGEPDMPEIPTGGGIGTGGLGGLGLVAGIGLASSINGLLGGKLTTLAKSVMTKIMAPVSKVLKKALPKAGQTTLEQFGAKSGIGEILGSAVTKAMFPVAVLGGLEAIGAITTSATTEESTPQGMPVSGFEPAKQTSLWDRLTGSLFKKSSSITTNNTAYDKLVTGNLTTNNILTSINKNTSDANKIAGTISSGITGAAANGPSGIATQATAIMNKVSAVTTNVLKDFAKGGAGWKSGYTPGENGAPSVDYGGIDPYYSPYKDIGDSSYNNAVQNTTLDSGQKLTYPFKDQYVTEFGNKRSTVKDTTNAMLDGFLVNAQEAKTNSENQSFIEAAEKQKILNSGANQVLTNEQYGGATGTYETDPVTGDTYKIYPNGTRVLWKKASSMAVGGIMKSSGIIQAHAGEVISPISSIADMVSKLADQKLSGDSSSAPSVVYNINVTVTGDANKDVTDDMIRKIKRELYGRGAI